MAERLTGEPAGLARRLAAMVYDTLIIAAILMIAGFSVLPFTGGKAVPAGTIWFEVYLFLVIFAYIGWCQTHGGQTLGMLAWRLYATDDAGGWIGWRKAFLRYCLAWPSVLLGLLGVLWSAFDPARKALHERFSGTRTLYAPNRPL